MPTPPMFHERELPAQIVVAGVVPAVVGGLAGILIGASSGAYWVLAILAAVGAFLSGFEHREVGEAALRGAASGLIYGLALLLLHAIVGTHAKVSLGSTPVLLAVVTAIVGSALASVGAFVARGRRAGGVPVGGGGSR